MRTYSTTEAAKRLNLHRVTLQRYIAAKKVSAPPARVIAGARIRYWSLKDIERVRKQLPKLTNGRRKKKAKK